jgi:hypothetical protein
VGTAGYRAADDVRGQVKGYASAASVNRGDSVDLYVSVNPAQRVRASLYRLGWYGGAGGRLVYQSPWLAGRTQPACPMDAGTGMVACHWRRTLVLATSASWLSGLYLVVLTNADGYQNAIPLVIRDDEGAAPLLYVLPVTTYQAYNNWPGPGHGGKSLYADGSGGGMTDGGTRAAVAVSFDRPYYGNGAPNLYLFDEPFVAWLEKQGYDVSYAASTDLDEQGLALLTPHRAVVVAGHDEYWTARMLGAAIAARDAGVSFAFFGANNVYWQARLEKAADGAPARVLVCYRSAARDPEPEPALKTVRWRDPPVSRPEQLLLGSMYAAMASHRAPWVVAQAGSWVYEGTGVHDGEALGSFVFGEVDRPRPGTPSPPHRSFEVVSRSPIAGRDGGSTVAEAVVYQAPSGAWVFDAGTFGWPEAVDPRGSPDARLQRVTANILNRMVGLPSAVPRGVPW